MTGNPNRADAARDEGPIGARRRRREDPALLTGAAEYTDDIRRPDTVHLALLRSQHGHARIEGIETAGAEALDGVLDVVTSADLADAGMGNRLPAGEADFATIVEHPILAERRVRYQGEPIVAVVAADRYTAHDALGAIEVEYDRLDAVTDPAEAMAGDAPALHDAAPDNVVFEWELGDERAVDGAFERAATTTEVELENNRVVPAAMEPRAAVATPDERSGELLVELSTQNPHTRRAHLAEILDRPESSIRVRAPAVGGGFGSKLQPYSGHTLAAWCASRLDRPVTFQATRSEGFASTIHARDHVTRAAVALDDDGTVRGLRAETTADLGAYVAYEAPHLPTELYGRMITGQYRIPAVHLTVTGAFTNTTPTSAYRGAGRPEACYLIERTVAAAARELDVDPATLRRRNFVPPDAFPYETATGHTYDSGNYEGTLDRALELLDYGALRDRQERLRERDRYLGVGFSCYVDAVGGPAESAETGLVRIDRSGRVVARSGTTENGQGHRTAFAQLLADALGVSGDDIEILDGDTDGLPDGQGTAGSRSMAVGGSALVRSAEEIVETARTIAAHRLEASEEDVAFEDGTFHVQGAPERAMHLQEVAAIAHEKRDLPDGMDPGLEATTAYDPSTFTFPFGTHAAVVEVDPGTGGVAIENYVAVTDVGRQVNPTLVEGQVHGGVAQGIGQALLEGTVYSEGGTLLSGSLQDYAVPKAFHVPSMETDSTETPCPHNPTGAKGVGESGAIAAPPAVVNAVLDALEPLGVEAIDMPLTDETVWRAITGSRDD